jgi:hypothetical protein
MSDLEFGQSYF